MAIPTIGGQATRGETFAKLIHHLREAQDMAAVMAHLHNTEGNDMDKLLAKGWLGIESLIKRMTEQVTKLAMKRMQ
jgi:hypothetical protein